MALPVMWRSNGRGLQRAWLSSSERHITGSQSERKNAMSPAFSRHFLARLVSFTSQ